MARTKKRRSPRKSAPKRRRQITTNNSQKTTTKRLDVLLTAVRNAPEDIEARLALAEYYLRQGLDAKIVDAFDGIGDDYPFANNSLRYRFEVLTAYGNAIRGNLAEADSITHRGLEDNPDSLDFLYILTYVQLSLREYRAARETANRFLGILDHASPPSMFVASPARLHNFGGTAALESGDFDVAAEAFEKSIALDPTDHQPYLNLARLHRRRREMEMERRVVDRGIKACAQIHELRMYRKSLESGASVSVCMIVKNEEEMLPGCLESIRDWVDEIIVVDTGSSDRTVEIAESYGAKMFFQEWEGDFSKHRNYSLEQASGDWIFIIDADERIYQEDIPLIRRVLNQDKFRVVSINVYNVSGDKEETVTFLPSIRFFKRELNLRYEGIVHNLLKVPSGETPLRAGIRLKHYGYGLSPEKMAAKIERSRALLEKQLAENPDNFHAHFNYAQLLRGVGLKGHPEFAGLIAHSASRAMELANPEGRDTRHIHLMALHQLAWVNFVTGEYNVGEDFCRRAISIKANYLDAILLLGHACMKQGKLEQAKDSYSEYLEMQAAYDESLETDNIMLLNPDSAESAYYGLGVIAEQEHDSATAMEMFEKSLKTVNGFLDTNYRLGLLYLQDGRIGLAETCFEKQLERDPESLPALMGMADVHFRRNEFDGAINCFEKALGIEPDNCEVLEKYGQVNLEIGRNAEALTCFEQLVDLGQASKTALTRLASLCFQMERIDEAQVWYQRILEDYEATPQILNDLGNCRFRLGHDREAAEAYERALAMSGCPALAYRNLALARARLEEPAEAIEALLKYRELNSEDIAVEHLMGDLYSRTGDFKQAMKYYERFLLASPDDPLALYNLSECYRHLGHFESAVMGYRRVLQKDPDFAPAQARVEQLTPNAEEVVEPPNA